MTQNVKSGTLAAFITKNMNNVLYKKKKLFTLRIVTEKNFLNGNKPGCDSDDNWKLSILLMRLRSQLEAEHPLTAPPCQ